MRKEMIANSDLFEYVGEVSIGSEAIDENGHLNNAYYQTVYETQRSQYLAACGINLETIPQLVGLRPFMVDFSGRFDRQVFENDQVTVHTAAVDARSHLLFIQRMVKGDIQVGHFQCTIYVVDENAKPKRMPIEARERINQINASKEIL